MDNVAVDMTGIRVNLVDAYRYPGADEWDASGGVHAKAVNSAVQSHKHAIHIHHGNGADVVVPGRVFFCNGIIGILLCLFTNIVLPS